MKVRTALCTVVGLFLLPGSALLADPVRVGDQMYANGLSPQAGQLGGPYLLRATGTSTFANFTSFCVELEQPFAVDRGPVASYTVIDIGDTNTSGKTMSGYTAWLYTN